jgi:Serine/threonine protein kinase
LKITVGDSGHQLRSKVLSGPASRTFTLCGTPEYLAPEILMNKGHGLLCDWWAFGVFLSEMLHGYPPFVAEDPFEIYQKILANEPSFSPQLCDGAVTDLMQRLLVTAQTARLGAEGGAKDVLVHE